MPKHWISLLSLILITVVFIVLWESSPDSLRGKRSDRPETAEYPSVYLVNPYTREYNKDGLLNFEFKAKHFRHYQIDPGQEQSSDYALIDSPHIVLYDHNQDNVSSNSNSDDKGNNIPWIITADSAHSNFDGSIITFSGNVLAWQTINSLIRNELKTEKLILEPNKKFAQTDKAVTISNPGNIVNGVGMQAFLQSNIIKLLSRVKSVHELKP